MESDYIGFDRSKEVDSTISNPGRSAIKKFIEEDSERPDVAFGGEGSSFKDLGCHIEGRA
jgi:hypothetical protein